MNHSGLWSGTHWLAGIFLLAFALPALPGDKYEGDCKAENCEEWDESSHDCVPMPKDCWELETVPAGNTEDCGACSLGFCGDSTVQTYSHNVAVETCKGSAGYDDRLYTIVEVHKPCGLEPDVDAMANAVDGALECLMDSSFAASIAAAVGEFMEAYDATGDARTALITMGAASIADLLEAICECISCSPCDYVKCSVADYGLPSYSVESDAFLTGGDCP